MIKLKLICISKYNLKKLKIIEEIIIESSLKIYTQLEDNIFSNKDASIADIEEIFSLK